MPVAPGAKCVCARGRRGKDLCRVLPAGAARGVSSAPRAWEHGPDSGSHRPDAQLRPGACAQSVHWADAGVRGFLLPRQKIPQEGV